MSLDPLEINEMLRHLRMENKLLKLDVEELNVDAAELRGQVAFLGQRNEVRRLRLLYPHLSNPYLLRCQ